MVHDFATEIFLPVFFVLCTSKTQDMYWNVINSVVVACDEKLLPETVVCDFEAALIDAVHVQFKDARVVGCYFHFKQACMRYMKKLSISQDAIQIAMTRGFLDMLTVIPPHKVSGPGIKYARAKIEARCKELSVIYSSWRWAKFWRYFKKTWVQKYNPQDWNVHDIEKPLVSRTNNPLERFNREINSAIGSPHPSLPRFVSVIDNLSERYSERLADLSKLRSTKRRRTTPESCMLPDEIDLESEDEEDSGVVDDGSSSENSANSSNDTL